MNGYSATAGGSGVSGGGGGMGASSSGWVSFNTSGTYSITTPSGYTMPSSSNYVYWNGTPSNIDTLPKYYPADKQAEYGKILVQNALFSSNPQLPFSFVKLDARGVHAFIMELDKSIATYLKHPAGASKKLKTARTLLALVHEKVAA